MRSFLQLKSRYGIGKNTLQLTTLMGVVTLFAAMTPSASALDPIDLDPMNVPPAIVGFEGQYGPTVWTFYGQVLDEAPVGMVIHFGGLLEGHMTTVTDSDGYFWYSVELTSAGAVTAYTTDDHNVDSDVVSYLIEG